MGDSGQIGTFVRSWLHYDNLASSLYKQANRARQVKDEYEGKIITELRNNNMENAVIQINSGLLNVTEERNPKALSLVRIEQLLHNYFQRKGQSIDETKDIMNYIRSNRGYDVMKKLKKSGGTNVPPLPPPPPMNGGMQSNLIGR